MSGPELGVMRFMDGGYVIRKDQPSKRSSAPSSASGKPAQNTTAKATAPTKPVQRTQPQPTATDQMVQDVIRTVRAEKAEEKRRADAFQMNQRKLLAQVAGVSIDQLDTFRHE